MICDISENKFILTYILYNDVSNKLLKHFSWSVVAQTYLVSEILNDNSYIVVIQRFILYYNVE